MRAAGLGAFALGLGLAALAHAGMFNPFFGGPAVLFFVQSSATVLTDSTGQTVITDPTGQVALTP